MNPDPQIMNDFPNGGRIYLNNASVSLVPSVSMRAMTEFLIEYNSLGPDSLDSGQFVVSKLQNIRRVISQMIKCQPEEIVLTQSVTDGINMVASGMRFGPGSNLIIRGTAHEHHANYYPWLRIGQEIHLRSLPVDNTGLFELEQLRQFLDEDTRLVALSHALYNTGTIMPIEEAGELLEKRGVPYFLDAAQSIGCMGDFDVGSAKCDFMSFNGSKWLCGPMGTGIFYCKKSSADLLRPTGIGGESAMLYEGSKLAYKDMPDRFQTGFRNYVGMVGLESSARYLLRYGLQNIRQKLARLSTQLRDDLLKIPGITLYGPEDPELRTSIVSFNLAGHKPEDIVERLERSGIVLAVREILSRKLVRASPHFFNSEEEIQSVVDSIKSL